MYFPPRTTTNMNKKFCPACGNQTMTKVSVSVDETTGGQQLYFSKRKTLNKRGLKVRYCDSQGFCLSRYGDVGGLCGDCNFFGGVRFKIMYFINLYQCSRTFWGTFFGPKMSESLNKFVTLFLQKNSFI